MGGLSWWHWIIILSVFVLLFGAKKLPDAARGVGRSLRILKSEVSAMSDDDTSKDESGETNRPAEALATPTPVVGAIAPVLQNSAGQQLSGAVSNVGVRSSTAA
ncbi:MAG: Sec-independent protein translocase subunit TatA [Nakamurella sp.]